MAGQSVDVKPGPSSTQIAGGPLPEGSLLYNQDPVNAIWISSSRSVAPNNGIYVGPLGTATLRNDRQAWAVVDIGVTTPVTITITNDVSNVNNPVDIGIAVATALLESGVQSNVKTVVLGSGVMAAGAFLDFDVAGYSYVNIEITPSAQATPRAFWLSGVNQISQVLWRNVTLYYNYATPVQAPTFRLDNQFSANSITYTVTATTGRFPPGSYRTYFLGGNYLLTTIVPANTTRSFRVPVGVNSISLWATASQANANIYYETSDLLPTVFPLVVLGAATPLPIFNNWANVIIPTAPYVETIITANADPVNNTTFSIWAYPLFMEQSI